MARATRVVAATALCLLVHGCAAQPSGAVELSWRLRPQPGEGVTTPFLSCDPAVPGAVPVAEIQLDWEVDGVPGAGQAWACSDNRGATGFELPPGLAHLTISPRCAGAGGTVPAAPGTFIAPAPIARQVSAGDAVSLGAVVLVVQTSSCDRQPCICQ